MNPVEASQPARAMRMLRLFSIVLASLAAPVNVAAQTVADRASVNRVVELLFLTAGEYGDEVTRHPGSWSVVIAKFAKGDTREVQFAAKVGEEYSVEGVAESNGTDVDICVYGPDGRPVECDTLDDHVPIVAFTAKTEGTYRAVMTASSVLGGGMSFAGMMVLRRVDEVADGPARCGGGSGK